MSKKRKSTEEPPPPGGWMGPPPTNGLPAIAEVDGVDKKGRWKWRKLKLSKKDVKRRKKFFDAMAKADKKKKWHLGKT